MNNKLFAALTVLGIIIVGFLTLSKTTVLINGDEAYTNSSSNQDDDGLNVDRGSTVKECEDFHSSILSPATSSEDSGCGGVFEEQWSTGYKYNKVLTVIGSLAIPVILIGMVTSESRHKVH